MEDNKNSSVAFHFDFPAFLRLCLKFWKWYLIICFIFAAYGAYSYFKNVPRLRISASVMLPSTSGSTSMILDIAKNFSLGDMFGGSSSTENESLVLGSYDQFLRTTHKLGLNVTYAYKGKLNWKEVHLNPPLHIDFAQSIADTLNIVHYFELKFKDDGKVDFKIKIGKSKLKIKGKSIPCTLNLPTGDFTFSKTETFDKYKTSKFSVFITSYNNAAQGIANSVDISIPSKKADFLDISYLTLEPEFGILLLNTVIESYNDIADTQKDLRNNRTLQMVNNRLASLSSELATSEQEIETFKRDNNLTDIEADAQLLLQQVGSFENSLLIAQTENAIIKSTRDFINNPENRYQLIPSLATGSSISGNNSTSESNSAISEYNRLVLERMKMMTSAKNNNTTLKLIDEQLDALLSNIKESVERTYINSNIALKDIKSKAGNTQSVINSYPKLERQFLGLKRNQLVQEQLYLFLLKQREEALISLSTNAQSCVTIDQPHVLALPVGWGPFMRVFIYSFFGFIIASVLIFLLKYIKVGFFDLSGLKAVSKVPVLGEITGDVDLKHVDFSKETLQTRADLIFTLDQIKGNRLLVTSTASGQGDSYAALAISASLANMGKKTILVVADYRTSYFDGNGSNLVDYVDGTSSLAPAIKSNYMSISGLDAITSGETDTPVRVLASPRMATLVEELHAEYDYVVIAAPEVNDYAETFALAPMVDLTLMVLRAKVATPENIQYVNKLASEGRFPNIAIVSTQKI